MVLISAEIAALDERARAVGEVITGRTSPLQQLPLPTLTDRVARQRSRPVMPKAASAANVAQSSDWVISLYQPRRGMGAAASPSLDPSTRIAVSPLDMSRRNAIKSAKRTWTYRYVPPKERTVLVSSIDVVCKSERVIERHFRPRAFRQYRRKQIANESQNCGRCRHTSSRTRGACR